MADLPRLPRLPDADENERPPTETVRNMATYGALLVLLALAAGLLFLVAMVIPGAMVTLVAVAVLPAYFLFHYLVWGRLMRGLGEEPDSSREDVRRDRV